MKEFKIVKEKVSLLENAIKEKNKKKIRDLIIDIIVGLEKICHRKDMDIHYVLGEAKEICKRAIKK